MIERGVRKGTEFKMGIGAGGWLESEKKRRDRQRGDLLKTSRGYEGNQDVPQGGSSNGKRRQVVTAPDGKRVRKKNQEGCFGVWVAGPRGLGSPGKPAPVDKKKDAEESLRRCRDGATPWLHPAI